MPWTPWEVLTGTTTELLTGMSPRHAARSKFPLSNGWAQSAAVMGCVAGSRISLLAALAFDDERVSRYNFETRFTTLSVQRHSQIKSY